MKTEVSRISQGLEITRFKLLGYAMEEFIIANKSIDDWLKKQPGFQLRRIAIDDDGLITDLLIWDTVAQGEDAMTRIISETSDSKVHEMINHRTVEWICIPVVHGVTK
jgi:hypothetical protein